MNRTFGFTVEASEEGGLAHGVGALGGRVALVVTFLGAADQTSVGVDFVRDIIGVGIGLGGERDRRESANRRAWCGGSPSIRGSAGRNTGRGTGGDTGVSSRKTAGGHNRRRGQRNVLGIGQNNREDGKTENL